MDPTVKDIVIRCGTCTYCLAYPAFFLVTTKANLRKIIRAMYRYAHQNGEVIQYLEQEIPNLVSTVSALGEAHVANCKLKVLERQADYERDFFDPDPKTFPPGMTKDQIRAERQFRREWNAVRAKRVKEAQTNHQRAITDARNETDRAKQVCELFLSEKR